MDETNMNSDTPGYDLLASALYDWRMNLPLANMGSLSPLPRTQEPEEEEEDQQRDQAKC
jgi:hypothetical protein